MGDHVALFLAAKKRASETGSLDGFRKLEMTSDEAMELYNLDNGNITYILYVKKLPFDVLDKLARIGDERVKLDIAIKYPLLRHTYEYLSTQSDEIKVRLFSNKKLPPDIASRLLQDPSDYVRRETARWAAWRNEQKKR
jgi:hypothetical protein